MEQELHSITYTAGEDWQFRESLISRDLFLESFMNWVVLMKGQVLQFLYPQGEEPPWVGWWGLSCFRV